MRRNIGERSLVWTEWRWKSSEGLDWMSTGGRVSCVSEVELLDHHWIGLRRSRWTSRTSSNRALTSSAKVMRPCSEPFYQCCALTAQQAAQVRHRDGTETMEPDTSTYDWLPPHIGQHEKAAEGLYKWLSMIRNWQTTSLAEVNLS